MPDRTPVSTKHCRRNRSPTYAFAVRSGILLLAESAQQLKPSQKWFQQLINHTKPSGTENARSMLYRILMCRGGIVGPGEMRKRSYAAISSKYKCFDVVPLSLANIIDEDRGRADVL